MSSLATSCQHDESECTGVHHKTKILSVLSKVFFMYLFKKEYTGLWKINIKGEGTYLKESKRNYLTEY